MANNEKKMSFKDLLFTGVGLTIGAGVVSTVGPVIGITGRSAWLAYMVAIVVGMLTCIPHAFFSSTFRVNGGAYTCIRSCLGNNVGGIYICTNILVGFNYATFAIASGSYISSLIPGLNSRLVAAIVLIAFYLLNLKGLNLFVKIQSYMSYILLVALMIFGVYGFFHLDTAVFDFSSPEFFTGGSSGFISGVTMFMFSTIAYSALLSFSGKAENPKRDIPRAMLGTIVVIAIVYFTVSVTAAGVLPLEQVAGKTLLAVASGMWARPFVVIFVVAGPLMALFTTLNGNFASVSNPQLAAARDGWWPKAMAKTNKNGAPWVVYTVTFILAFIPILLDYSVNDIVGNMVIIFQVNSLFVSLACLTIPVKYPEAWKKSTLHVPTPVFYAINLCSLCAVVYAALYRIGELRTEVLVVTVVGYAIVIGYTQWRRMKGYVNISDTITLE